jgi:uncharacterized membrane protein
MAKLNPQRLLFGVFLLVLIVIGEIIFHTFHLPAWPAFMVMIFFFEAHMNLKKAPEILVGGMFGLLSVVLAGITIRALTPSMGQFPATVLFVVVAVYAIVAFGEILPIVFNNYAFMYLTVGAAVAKTQGILAALETKVPGLETKIGRPNPFLWIAIELVAGGLFIAGIIGILKIMGFLAQRKAQN